MIKKKQYYRKNIIRIYVSKTMAMKRNFFSVHSESATINQFISIKISLTLESFKFFNFYCQIQNQHGQISQNQCIICPKIKKIFSTLTPSSGQTKSSIGSSHISLESVLHKLSFDIKISRLPVDPKKTNFFIFF